MKTLEEKYVTKRLEFTREICIDLARERAQNSNWYLSQGSAAWVKRLVLRTFGKSEPHQVQRGSKQAAAVPEQGECCTAHLERSGERRKVFKNGLCHRCYEGEAIKQRENYGQGSRTPEFGTPEKSKPRTESGLALVLLQLEQIAAEFEVRP
jgi:hypothetical protein